MDPQASNSDPPTASGGGAVWGTAAVLTLLAVLVLAPSWPASGTGVPAHPQTDIYDHLWGYWWVGQGILESGRIPLASSITHYPPGGALYFIDPLGAIIVTVLGWLVSPTLAYWGLLVLQIVAGGSAAAALARRLGVASIPATLAGVIYGLSPYALAVIHNGTTELLHLWVLPTTILLGCWAAAPGAGVRWRRWVVLGVVWGLAAGSGWYLAVFTGMLLGLTWVWALITLPTRRTEILRGGLVTGLATALCSAPAIFAFRATTAAEDALVTPDSFFLNVRDANQSLVDAAGFVLPGGADFPPLRSEFLHVHHLGIAVVVLALIGWALHARSRAVGLGAVVFLVLACGRRLVWMGSYISVAGTEVWLPFHLLEQLPGLRNINYPYRLVVVVMLLLGISAAAGLDRLVRGRGRRWAVGATAAACAVVLGEFLTLSGVAYPIPSTSTEVPDHYRALAQEEGDFAVLDWPPDQVKLNERYAFFQTVHGKRIPYGVNVYIPDGLRENYLVQRLCYLSGIQPPPRTPPWSRDYPLRVVVPQMISAQKELVGHGYRYLILHPDALAPENLDSVRQTLNHLLTLLDQPDAGVEVYEL
jgi:hypothetical protein